MPRNVYHVKFDAKKRITSVEYILTSETEQHGVLWNNTELVSVYAKDELNAFMFGERWLREEYSHA